MTEDQERKLIPINCPLLVEGKAPGTLGPCGRLTVRVSPNSYGESWCRTCREVFFYEVKGEVPTSKIKVKRVK